VPPKTPRFNDVNKLLFRSERQFTFSSADECGLRRTLASTLPLSLTILSMIVFGRL
jgi:hypothetical protein